MSRPGRSQRRWSLSRSVQLSAAACLFLLATIVYLDPLSLQPATTVRDPGDPLLNAWILAWVTRTIFTEPLHLFNANMLYPFPASLALSEALVGLLPIAAPVLLLTGNPVLAHNAVLLASFVLSALGAFALTLYLTKCISASIISGIIFAFSPVKVAHLGHIQSLSVQWMPLSLLYLHKGFTLGNWRYFWFYFIFFVLQSLSSFYHAFYFSIAIALFALCFASATPTYRDRLMKLAVSTGLAGLIMLPLTLPYLEIRRDYGFVRTVEEVTRYSLTPEAYLVAPSGSLIYGQLNGNVRQILNSDYDGPVAAAFFGLLPIGLAVIGAWFRGPRERRFSSASQRNGARFGRVRALLRADPDSARVRAYYLLLAAGGAILSFGPTLRAFGTETTIPLPYLPLYEFVPGFQALRVPARFVFISLLGVSVLAGLGAARLRASTPGRLRPAILFLALMFAVLAESATRPIETVPVPVGDALPPVYRWLSQQEADAVVVELPAEGLFTNVEYVYASTAHWRRLVNGYSGFLPEEFYELTHEADRLPAEDSIDLLRALGVDLIVVHGDKLPPERWRGLQQGLAAVAGVSQVARFGADSVFRLTQSETTADTPRLNVSLPSFVPAGQMLTVPLSVSRSDDRVGVFLPGPGARFTGQARWAGPKTLEYDFAGRFPLFVRSQEEQVVGIDVPVPPTPGVYRLTVSVESPRGRLTAEARAEVVGSLLDSRSTRDLRPTLTQCSLPDRVQAGLSFRFRCLVGNTGRAVWLGSNGTNHQGWVAFGLRDWQTPDGRPGLDRQGRPLEGRARVPWPIMPGQSLQLAAETEAPARPGLYTVRLDLVVEQLFWYGDLRPEFTQQARVLVERGP